MLRCPIATVEVTAIAIDDVGALQMINLLFQV